MKGVTYELMRKRIARTAVGPTTLRNMKGTDGKRDELFLFFDSMPLTNIDGSNFSEQLDRFTGELSKIFGGNWGAARKSINLFFRDILYCEKTRSELKFDLLESCLECPLDSYTMKGVIKDGKLDLKAPSVSKLNSALSTEFQKHARTIARKRSTYPVHLDLFYYLADRGVSTKP